MHIRRVFFTGLLRTLIWPVLQPAVVTRSLKCCVPIKLTMKIDFVSLQELVQSIAHHIPIEDHVLNPSLNRGRPLDADDAFLKQAALRQLEGFHQEARAAAKLGNYLATAPREVCPRWFAPGPTGDYWATEHARKEGLAILESMAAQERMHREARERNLRSRPEWRIAPPPVEMPKMPRSRQLGFERGELLCFLGQYQIRHALGEIAPIRRSEMGLSAPELTNPSGLALSVQSRGSISIEKKVEPPNFNGPLRDVLRKAWTNADEPKDRSTIFAALIDLANAESPIRPLIEYSREDDAVKYEDRDQVKFFDREDMRQRMRTVDKVALKKAS